MTAHSTPAEQGDGGGPRRVWRTSTAAVVVVLIVAAGLFLALRGDGSTSPTVQPISELTGYVPWAGV